MHFTNFIRDKVKEIIKISKDNIKFSWDKYTSENNYVVYQLEQLNIPNKLTHEYLKLLHNADKIYEYSQLNLDLYPKDLINKVEFKPFFPSLESKRNNLISHEIDILFYGYISNRRQKILSELRKKYRTIFISHDLSLSSMQSKINNSLFVLSCGTYSNLYNDSFRVSLALDLGANILYEETSEKWYDEYIFNNFSDRITIL
jgi:hypothetical protein